MLGFIKKCFFYRISIFIITNLNSFSCISINIQECKVRPEIVNVNSNEPIFYPFSIRTSKCSDSCNSINDLYAKLYVPDVVKNLNMLKI